MCLKRLVEGDFIQWESQGSLFFDEPRKVRNVVESKGNSFVLVENEHTGIPIDQALIMYRCREHYGEGIWRCPECQEGWTAEILFKAQIPLPCNCPHCHEKLVFEESFSLGSASK